MGIENITETILADAKEDARRSFEKGRYDTRDVIREAQHKAEVIKADAQQRGEQDAELLKKRKDSVAQLEARKMRLFAKQQVIAQSFDLALKKLAKLPAEEYASLLSKAVSRAGLKEGELLLTEKDREAVGQRILDLVREEDKNNGLTLSQSTINGAGGFVLRYGAVEINSTLETMVNAVKEAATPQVVETLFG